jgi:hypothetical protein
MISNQTVISMAVRNVEQMTPQEVEADLSEAVLNRFGMTLHAFFAAVKSGQLTVADPAVKEYMRISKFLPDGVAPECPSTK